MTQKQLVIFCVLATSVASCSTGSNSTANYSSSTSRYLELAMEETPAEQFVDSSDGPNLENEKSRLIGKTLYIAEQASISPGSKVLEIGTGSGYQAALFDAAGASVFTVEISEEAARDAASRFNALGREDIRLRVGDGFKGWEEHAPFDAIVVRASSPLIPVKLVKQLSNRGRLVIPVEYGEEISLVVIERQSKGYLTRIRPAKDFSKLQGEVRSKPAVKIKELSDFSLVEQLLRGE